MAEKLKDIFFQRPFFEALCEAVARVDGTFERDAFFARLYAEGWESLELKQRMRRASEALRAVLPADYREAVAVLLAVEAAFEGFDHLLFSDFVERFGVDDFEASIPALEVFTRTSAEFAIRHFLVRYPEATFARMRVWSTSVDEHLRRLASEGCRPRLPWAVRVPALLEDPRPIWPILEELANDPSEYVRRSVANNLNDIAKDHPEAVLEVAERWLSAADASAALRGLVKHALRTLLKRGNKRALALFGLADATAIDVTHLSVVPEVIAIGDSARLEVALAVSGEEARLLRLEYEVHYARPNGRSAVKVFQLGELTAEPGSPVELARTLKFADLSTRTHHPGAHRLLVVANGARLAEVTFELRR